MKKVIACTCMLLLFSLCFAATSISFPTDYGGDGIEIVKADDFTNITGASIDLDVNTNTYDGIFWEEDTGGWDNWIVEKNYDSEPTILIAFCDDYICSSSENSDYNKERPEITGNLYDKEGSLYSLKFSLFGCWQT